MPIMQFWKPLLDNKTEFVIRVNKETIFFPPPNKELGRANINRFLSILDCKKDILMVYKNAVGIF